MPNTDPRRIETIVRLCHRFGSSDFVKGGGGNASCKDEEWLHIKGSGLSLAGTNADNLVPMDRSRIRELFSFSPPAEVQERERRVARYLAEAVTPAGRGRPSVEAPLHELFEAVYVVHTHPPLVNGLTCARDAEAHCRRLFPDALWIPYTDPGYSLSMRVRADMEAYRAARGRQPSLVFLQNHGVFVAADTPEAIESLYAGVMGTLAREYAERRVPTTLKPEAEESALLGADHPLVRTLPAGRFTVLQSRGFEPAPGPLTPDHIVYAGAFPKTVTNFTDIAPDGAAADGAAPAGAAPAARQGLATDPVSAPWPRVVSLKPQVFVLGKSLENATLVMDICRDGALVAQLTEAFGGPRYMDDRERGFIENWEAEHYRAKTADAKAAGAGTAGAAADPVAGSERAAAAEAKTPGARPVHP